MFLHPSRLKQEPILSEQPATRLFVRPTLSTGGEIELDPAQAHRLRNVLRLGDGAVVAAFNGESGEFLCRVIERGKRRLALLVERQLRTPEEAADVWLIFAPLKRARLDWLVEKASELGARGFFPVWTTRTQPERLNRERLQAIAVAAAEQSERLSVPEIGEPQRLDRLLADWPVNRRLIVCDETGGGAPIAAVLPAMPADEPAALLVGPEGGFAETELDALGKLPIVTRVGLGPRVLRAETAALAALAVFQAIAGDWRRNRQR